MSEPAAAELIHQNFYGAPMCDGSQAKEGRIAKAGEKANCERCAEQAEKVSAEG